MNSVPPSHPKVFPLVNTIVFVLGICCYLFFKFSYHELWKDEWQAWMVARDLDWTALPAFLFYEGHPALWYFYLKFWTLLPLGLEEATMLHIAHSVPVLVVYFILFFRFNFSLLLRIALFFSYFLFFEYGIVDRGYVFVILLGSIAVLLMRQPKQGSTALAISLFALCQTEVYGLIMGGALMLYLLLGHYFKTRNLSSLFRSPELVRPAAGLLLGVLVFTATVYPRGEKDELSRAYLDQPFSSEVAAKAFQGGFANTYCIGLLPDTNISGVSPAGLLLSFAVLIALAWFFWADKRLLLAFGAFSLVLYLFLISIYTGGVRQWGMAFVFFVLCLQLWTYSNPKFKLYQHLILGLFLACQLWHSGRALLKDYRHPFSNSISAGTFIRDKVPANVPIVAINKFEAAPVSGYAGRPFSELPTGNPFTYFKWLEKVYIPPEAELKLFAQFKKSKGLIVLTHQKLPQTRYPNLRLWQEFDRYSFKNENYYLYLLELEKE